MNNRTKSQRIERTAGAIALLTIGLVLAFAIAYAPKAVGDDYPQCNAHPYAGLYNISTRAYVGDRLESAVAGFIIRGDGPICVAIRGRGQSVRLPEKEILLTDPWIRLFRQSDKALLDANDNWRDGEYADVLAETFPGTMADTDAGIFACLKPGGYTVKLSPRDFNPGIGIVEVIDVNFDFKADEFNWCDDDDDDDRDCNEEDDDRGHGNDCDRDDDDNPGRGNGK